MKPKHESPLAVWTVGGDAFGSAGQDADTLALEPGHEGDDERHLAHEVDDEAVGGIAAENLDGEFVGERIDLRRRCRGGDIREGHVLDGEIIGKAYGGGDLLGRPFRVGVMGQVEQGHARDWCCVVLVQRALARSSV